MLGGNFTIEAEVFELGCGRHLAGHHRHHDAVLSVRLVVRSAQPPSIVAQSLLKKCVAFDPFEKLTRHLHPALGRVISIRFGGGRMRWSVVLGRRRLGGRTWCGRNGNRDENAERGSKFHRGRCHVGRLYGGRFHGSKSRHGVAWRGVAVQGRAVRKRIRPFAGRIAFVERRIVTVHRERNVRRRPAFHGGRYSEV